MALDCGFRMAPPWLVFQGSLIQLPPGVISLLHANVFMGMEELRVGLRGLLVKGVGEAGGLEPSLQCQHGNRLIQAIDF